MTFKRNGSNANIVGYSITSGAGTLNSTNWKSIANNYDSDSGTHAVDSDDAWTILSPASSVTELTEIEFDGNGGTLTAGTDVQIGNAGTWQKFFIEDVRGRVALADGSQQDLLVHFVGNSDFAFKRSDLDFDGDIDLNDWSILISNHLSTISPTLTDAQSYALGDINGDQLNDLTDYRLFKADYLAANGPGSGAGLFGSVPEPTTISLLLMAVFAPGLVRRRRTAVSPPVSFPTGRSLLAGLAALLLLAAAPIKANAQAPTLRDQFRFNEAAGATTVTDSVDGGNGLVVGNILGTGAVSNGAALQLPGGAPGSGFAYVDLPNGFASSLTGDASFEVWYTQNTGNAWSRIWDFGSAAGLEITSPAAPTGAAGDTFFFAPNRNGNINQQRMGMENDEAFHWNSTTLMSEAGPTTNTTNGDPNVTTALGSQVHVVVNYQKQSPTTAGPRITTYINGTSVNVINGTQANHQLSELNDVNAWLGKSNYSGDNQFGGLLNEFRVYNGLLDADTIGADAYLGPDVANPKLPELVVDVASGAVSIKNDNSVSLPAFDYYRITSTGGALSPAGWTSIDGTTALAPVGTRPAARMPTHWPKPTWAAARVATRRSAPRRSDLWARPTTVRSLASVTWCSN